MGWAGDAPDGIRVYNRMLNVRMYNGELVGIDLRCAKKESERVLCGGSDGHAARQKSVGYAPKRGDGQEYRRGVEDGSLHLEGVCLPAWA